MDDLQCQNCLRWFQTIKARQNHEQNCYAADEERPAPAPAGPRSTTWASRLWPRCGVPWSRCGPKFDLEELRRRNQ